MLKVKILRLNNDGTQRIVCVCKLKDKEVICEGEDNLLTYLKEEGIKNYSSTSQKKVFPADGKVFLEQLKNNFKSGYINASEIEEE